MSSAVSSTNTFLKCDGTPASNHCDSSDDSDRALECCEQIAQQQIPNFLRLFVNPDVAGCCLGLSELSSLGFPQLRSAHVLPSFLANSGDDALSGAFKLARFWRSTLTPATGDTAADQTATPSPVVDLLIDETAEYSGFCHTVCHQPESDSERQVNFIPGIRNVILSEGIRLIQEDRLYDSEVPRIVSITADSLLLLGDTPLQSLLELSDSGRILLIAVINARFLRHEKARLNRLRPDIVVFDQSFTKSQIPFGAITSRPDLLRIWHSRKLSMFHSTTFQPNTVSIRWFLECLKADFPDVHLAMEPTLLQLRTDRRACLRMIKQTYSPSLSRTIQRTGFDRAPVSTDGHYVQLGGRRIFDGVAGVACSLRGHNPSSWAAEVRQAPRGLFLRELVQAKLAELTGLSHFLPAVSGASAVEQALKLALAISPGGPDVVVMKRGYAGKTLFALTGTASDYYQRGVGPLYGHSQVIDPLAPDAVQQLEAIVSRQRTAAVLLELIQGVGGVREIPEALLNQIFQLRRQYGFRIIIDEVQTGVFRTGPFVRSSLLTERPDFLTIGKAVSDMMIPFSLTLYSEDVQQRLRSVRCSLPEYFRSKSDYELAFRTLWNTLYCQNPDRIREHVEHSGRLLETELRKRLNPVLPPEAIRVFGLLCGIELPRPQSGARKKLSSILLMLRFLHLMRNRDFPLLMGFCQFEPNVLKFTPPLSITDVELKKCCDTIAAAISASPTELLVLGLRSICGA